MTTRSTLNRRAFIGATAAVAATSCTAPETQAGYRRIACEEAFIIPEIRQALSDLAGGVPSMRSGPIAGSFMEEMLDIGPGRIARMTAAGIDMAVLSHTAPGVQNFQPDLAVALAELANDRLAEAVAAHPQHYAGLATVSPQAAEAGALELERSVNRLGLKGGIINSSTNDEYLDDQKFWPIFEAAEALDVPIYIHPREPSPSMGPALVIPGFTVGWGFGVECGTNAIRLIASGIFDRYPNLKIVLGHMGETIPMLLGRLDNRYLFETGMLGIPRLQRMPSEYFRENFIVTTSGMNYRDPLNMTIDAVGVENVLFAADYPLEDQAECVRNIEEAGFSEQQRRMIFDENQVRVFKL